MTVERPAPLSRSCGEVFIAGSWRAVHGEAVIVRDSGTEATLGQVASATAGDVDDAVSAARTALPSWSALAPAARSNALLRLHEALQVRREELISLISAEVGTAVRLCGPVQVESALNLLRLTAELAESRTFEERVGNSIVVQEPVGVVAAITPWNFPLFQVIAKVAAALAVGCTVVHKPSGLAPLSAIVLAQAVESAELPPGVYNLLFGPGATIGEALVRHADVQMVSFTGSTAAGARVYELAAPGIKRIALELGGKSPSVLLDDAILDEAVKQSVNRAFLNSGQTCDAWTRLLVPRARVRDVIERALTATERLVLGDPFDESTRLGPLVSVDQVNSVRGYIDGAIHEGARAVIGGSAAPAGLDRGYYVQPTVLTDVRPDMIVAQEEVFGPVLSVVAYDSEDEAVRIANGTQYGLSGAVWSADASRAEAFARRLRSGQVVINGGRFNPLAPAGGFKRSGLGRELGKYGMDEFLEPKALQL